MSPPTHSIYIDKISYVITVYNKQESLPKVIESLLRQQGDFEKEYIFIDDGSTDNSLNILQNYQKDNKNFIVKSQENQGPSRAFNHGLSLATGNYIKPLDGDDILTDNASAILLEILKKHNNAVAIGRETPTDRKPQIQDIIVQDSPLKKSIRRAQTGPSMWMAEKKLVDKSNYCDEGVFIQDYSIELRLAKIARFVFTKEIVFKIDSDCYHLSDNEGQILHDLTLALANFLRDNENDLPKNLQKYALMRAAGRAKKWAKRHGNISQFLRAFFYYFLAYIGVKSPSYENIYTCTKIFTQTNHNIRLIQ